MLRFQASWLMETIMDNITESSDPNWHFPCLWKFTALEWLSHLNNKFIINVPIHSQAIIFKSWFYNQNPFPDSEVMRAFNQVLNTSIDINSNPFKDWLDIYFSKQQLAYLQYWREASGDIRDIALKESFLSIVYQVMNYWIINNKYGFENALTPDQIFSFYYKKYAEFREHNAKFSITEFDYDTILPENCSHVVFNLVFKDEDFIDDDSFFVYNAWLGGYTDLKESKKTIIEKIKPYYFEFGNTKNFSFYKRMTEKANSASFCWSGTGISLNLYKRFLVKPLQDVLDGTYKHSKLVYKPINPTKKQYDFILLFY